MRAVRSARPNATEFTIGKLVVIKDGDEVLSDFRIFATTYGEAWRNALAYLQRKHREGAQ